MVLKTMYIFAVVCIVALPGVLSNPIDDWSDSGYDQPSDSDDYNNYRKSRMNDIPPDTLLDTVSTPRLQRDVDATSEATLVPVDLPADVVENEDNIRPARWALIGGGYPYGGRFGGWGGRWGGGWGGRWGGGWGGYGGYGGLGGWGGYGGFYG